LFETLGIAGEKQVTLIDGTNYYFFERFKYISFKK